MENNSNGNGNGNGNDDGGGAGLAIIIFLLISMIVGVIVLVVWKVAQSTGDAGSGSPGSPGSARAPGPWVTVPLGTPAPNITKILEDIGKTLGVVAGELAIASLVKRDGYLRGLLKKALPEINWSTQFRARVNSAKEALLPTKNFAAYVRKNIARIPLKVLSRAGMRMTATKGASGASAQILAADAAAARAETAAARSAAGASARAARSVAIAEAGAARVAAGAGLGPFEAADIAFTAASMALDYKNVGNLADLNTTDDYKTWRRLYDQQTEDTFTANNQPPFQFAGPLSTLSSDAFDLAVQTEIFTIISEPTDAEASIVSKILIAMRTRWAAQGNKTMTVEDIEFSLGDTTLLPNSEYEQLANLAIDRACTKAGGVLLDPGKTGYSKVCSYKTAFECSAGSGPYPPPEDGQDHLYFEWRTLDYFNSKGFTTSGWGTQGGACLHASSGFRDMCVEEQQTDFGTGHDEYDIRDSNCYNSYTVCATVKRVQYDAGRRTCYVEPGQEFAELVFGTTVVRGLSGAFAPDGPINTALNNACTIM
jgi:hypothetical protein